MSQFIFKLDTPLPEEERREVERLLPDITASIIEFRRTQRQANIDQLVELFLGGVQPTPVDMDVARLRAKADAAVFAGTQWLDATEIGELANLGQANPFATVGRWKRQGRIFSIRHEAKDKYPRYGLGDDYRPLPAMAGVLKILDGYSGNRLAAWFESTSSFLGGRRPRELLATDPDLVMAAALDKVQAEEYAG